MRWQLVLLALLVLVLLLLHLKRFLEAELHAFSLLECHLAANCLFRIGRRVACLFNFKRACHLDYRRREECLSTLGTARFTARYGTLPHLHRRLQLKALLNATKRRRVIFIRTAVLFAALLLWYDIDVHVLSLSVLRHFGVSLLKLLTRQLVIRGLQLLLG